MQWYRVYAFDAGRIVHGEDLAAVDDEAAIETVRAQTSLTDRELWSGTRMVVRIAAEGLPGSTA